MKEEGFFLLDEISLADDSVLERLNRYVLNVLVLSILSVSIHYTNMSGVNLAFFRHICFLAWVSCSLNRIVLAGRENDPNNSGLVHTSTASPVCFGFLIVIRLTEVLVLITVMVRQFFAV